METQINQNRASTKVTHTDTETVTPRRYIGINWQRLSSMAWKCLLPLAITLSIFSVARQAYAINVGDTGSEVKNLQDQLKVAGFYSPNPTGYYGDVTQEAIRKFQRANKLPVTGLADAATMTKIQSRIAKINPASSRRPQVTAKTPTTNQTVNNNQNSDIARGDSGVEVKNLQERLRVAGYYNANSTGVFGVTTEAAVLSFQKANNLIADGIVGPATLKKLPAAGLGGGDDNSVHMRMAANTIKTTANRENLRRGDRGSDVLLLQDQLKKLGLFNSVPNGIYGPFTEAAVRQFQSTHYLQASGIAGPTTRGKLVQVVSQIPQSEQNNIVELQSRLQKQGFYDGPINGVMGDETRDALIQAQHKYRVTHTDITTRS